METWTSCIPRCPRWVVDRGAPRVPSPPDKREIWSAAAPSTPGAMESGRSGLPTDNSWPSLLAAVDPHACGSAGANGQWHRKRSKTRRSANSVRSGCRMTDKLADAGPAELPDSRPLDGTRRVPLQRRVGFSLGRSKVLATRRPTRLAVGRPIRRGPIAAVVAQSRGALPGATGAADRLVRGRRVDLRDSACRRGPRPGVAANGRDRNDRPIPCRS